MLRWSLIYFLTEVKGCSFVGSWTIEVEYLTYKKAGHEQQALRAVIKLLLTPY